MRESSCRVEQLSSASPTVAYDVLMDVDHWAEWMPTVSAASWERRGEPDTGKGGIRRVRNGISVTLDEITDGARPHQHAYSSATPWYFLLKSYRGDVRIEDHPRGSQIIWTVTFASSIPGLDKRLQYGVRSTYVRIAAALAREAERR